FILGDCSTKNASLSLANVVDSLNEDGIHFTEINDIDPDYAFKKVLNDVNPTLFSVNNNQMLSIYVFSSNAGVDAGIKEFENKTATADLEPYERYSIDNVLIFYILKEVPKNTDVVTAIERIQ